MVLDWEYSPDGAIERITKDVEIVRMALLLTGCHQSIRNTVADYFNSFSKVGHHTAYISQKYMAYSHYRLFDILKNN